MQPDGCPPRRREFRQGCRAVGGTSRKGIVLWNNAGSCLQEFRGMPPGTREGLVLTEREPSVPLNEKGRAVPPTRCRGRRQWCSGEASCDRDAEGLVASATERTASPEQPGPKG